MALVIYVTPYFQESAVRFLNALGDLPGIQLAAVSQDVDENLPTHVRNKTVARYRIDDALDAAQIVSACRWLSGRFGPIQRLVAVNEHVQVPAAEAREALGLPGLGAEVARNFRDKTRMKDLFHAAGVPCARHRQVEDAAAAFGFADEVGYPVVVKPPAGVGSASTYVATSKGGLAEALAAIAPSPASPVLLEEFVSGEEHSFDAVMVDGRPVWHSLTHYMPRPIEVVKNPWIQWCIVLPREIDDPVYDPIREHGYRALSVLGMETGICHLEWFRRDDGRVLISEVAARPGGAQIVTLNARAHDVDMYGELSRLLVHGTFDPPKERKYAAGAAFLRGQGPGTVRAVHGLEQAQRELGHLVTDAKIPAIGQPRSPSYEGEGYVLLRHPETRVVREALKRLVGLVRVEVGV